MSTEHKPVFPRKEFWKCSCGHVNFYETYTCIQCGKSETMVTYSDPCDRCCLCKEKKVEIDWLVRDTVRY